jgi:hypothetical protein
MARYQIETTPKGQLFWAYLFEPDTKFNAQGEYKANLRMDESEAQSFIAKLEQVRDEFFEEEGKRNPKAKARLTKSPVFTPVYDEHGAETGQVEFKTKLKAVGTRKDGTTWDQKPVVFDAKAKPITANIRIGNGSVGRLNVELVPYCMASSKAVGVSLRLKKAQIIALVEGENQSGFDVEEGGFEVTEEMINGNQNAKSNNNEEEENDFDF